jgi:metal-responsive CopG/Arc/MetJ family transcriptional regulator
MKKDNKEKAEQQLNMKIQKSLYEKLVQKSDKEYKSISQAIRDLIVQYVNEG